MPLDLAVLRDAEQHDTPGDDFFLSWCEAALAGRPELYSLDIRIVDEHESRRLNGQFRGKDHPSNVLSFAAEIPPQLAQGMGYLPLGDLAICAPLVTREALEQGKPIMHHWAHLTVHGVLHLLGHDHADDETAGAMESLERKILAGLGIPDPYQPI